MLDQAKSAAARGEGVVDRQGGYKLPIAYTHEELATMIGAERVTVSRILGSSRTRGLWN